MGSLSSRLRVSVLGAALAGVLLAPCPALADGPGYGGNADAVVCHWRLKAGTRGAGLAIFAVGFRAGSQVHLRVGATADRIVIADISGALRVLVVPAAASRTVPSHPAPSRAARSTPTPSRKGPNRTVVSNAFMIGPAARPVAAHPVAAKPTDTGVLTVTDDAVGRLSAGTSVLIVGETPAGALRTLVGSVPPPDGGSGTMALAPWVGGAALCGAVLFWTRRRRAATAVTVHRHRHYPRHRA